MAKSSGAGEIEEPRVEFFWQFCDPDAEIGTTFREGSGFDEFVSALRDFTALEGEQTPEGFIPSGNIHVYWSRVDRRSHV